MSGLQQVDGKNAEDTNVNVSDGVPANMSSPHGPYEEDADTSRQHESGINQRGSKAQKLCGVCKEKEAKYKCTRCFLPYCSVACSSAHKATHPASESPAVAASSAPPPPPPKQGSDSATSNRPRGPFAALEESTELQELFRMYPNLPSQLEAIYSATLPPTANNHTGESGNAGGTNNQINFGNWPGSKKKGQGGNRPWNQDIGLQSGVKALCKAREAYGKDGEAVREYSRLVLKILSRDDGLDAVEQIQKELAEENARLISQLLNGEM